MLWGSELEVSPPGRYMEEMSSGFAVAERRQHLGVVSSRQTLLCSRGALGANSISRL